MRPFVVRFALTEPGIVNPAIALDGILAAATFRRTHDPIAAHLHLPLAKHGDTYAASEVHYEAPSSNAAALSSAMPTGRGFSPGILSTAEAILSPRSQLGMSASRSSTVTRP